MTDWADPKVHPERHTGPVWNWFGLSYSAYLVVPRSLMCGMPLEWQRRMVALIEESREVYDTAQINDRYVVHLAREDGRWLRDPLADYRHPPRLPYASSPARWGALNGFQRWLWNIADFAHWHGWYGHRFWHWLIERLERRRFPEVTAALDRQRDLW